ncbi:BamA/TamA family outer membrane protein [Gemmatimonadota bacterium]
MAPRTPAHADRHGSSEAPGPSAPCLVLLALLFQLIGVPFPPGSGPGWGVLAAQEKGAENPPVGWEFTGIPAFNYDSDEGFGYGAVLAFYDYGPGGLSPYRATIQPTVFFTTEGRRELRFFFDTPHLLPSGWRLDFSLDFEDQVATPYYGLGNQTTYETEKEEGEDPYYYRFGRERRSARINLQRPLSGIPIRLLFGGGISHFTLDPTPKDQGTTLLSEALGEGGAVPGGTLVSLRAGVVWDTRDHESQPRTGVWSAFLVDRTDERLGSAASFTRWTVADRRYVPLGTRLVLAHRVILQTVSGDPPFFALQYVQSSYQGLEGLGGSKSLRGVLRNRFTGKGLFIWNAELRFRLLDFRFLGKDCHLVTSGFLDSGRVWESGLDLGGLVSGLHHGIGGGLRVGMGPNFVVGFDQGVSDEGGLQTYIGLGFLF